MTSSKRVISALRKHKRFLIAAHHNPDADAIASCLAMAIFLKSIGKTVHVLNEDAVPDWLRFLPQSSLCRKAAAEKTFDYDAAIILDCGEQARIGAVQMLLKPGKPIINIDHHITNDHFGDIAYIVPKASSTCEILYDIITAAGGKLTKSSAMLLYAGIMTDTGSFRYENTSNHTHAMVSKLMAFGLNAAHLHQQLFIGMPVKDLGHFTQVIHEAKLLLGNRVYCVTLSKNLLSKFSKSFDLKERIFGFLRSVEGIEVVVILTELGPKETRVNLRSQSAFNVAELAQQFKGGGHVKAAGAKVFDTLAVAQKQLTAAIAKRLK